MTLTIEACRQECKRRMRLVEHAHRHLLLGHSRFPRGLKANTDYNTYSPRQMVLRVSALNVHPHIHLALLPVTEGKYPVVITHNTLTGKSRKQVTQESASTRCLRSKHIKPDWWGLAGIMGKAQ